MEETVTLGRCCGVWLPDVVLPAAERLRVLLAGDEGANLAHLRGNIEPPLGDRGVRDYIGPPLGPP